MFIKFSETSQKVLKNAKKEMIDLHHAFIGSEHVLLSILNSNIPLSQRLKQYGITYQIFKEELIKNIGIGHSKNNYFIYTPLLKRILENAIIDTKESGNKEVSIDNIFLSILDEGEGVAIRILGKLGLNIDDLYEKINQDYQKKKSHKKSFICDFGVDLTQKCMKETIDPLIGREKEVDSLINILLKRNKNNPLLIGEAGVGKTAIVEELANRIVKKKVPEKLQNMQVYSISMASCVAGTKYRGEFEERISNLLKDLENNDKVILFIDEIHTIVGAGGAEGAIDASNILKPALARGKIKLIGATTIKEYRDTISKDKALNRRFQTIMISENTIDETYHILEKLKPLYEEYHHIKIKNDILKLIVSLTDKYLKDRHNPDKSIDILDMVCTKVSLKENSKVIKLNNMEEELNILKNAKKEEIIKHHFKEAEKMKNNELVLEDKINNMKIKTSSYHKKWIKANDVLEIIESITKVPLYENKKRNHLLLRLEKYLKSKIIGQDEVIAELSKITKKMFLGLKNNLPLSILFLGKSGVGKSKLVYEYSNYLKIPLIKLDMSEYKEGHSISKIIGSPPGYTGYDDYENVLEKIKNNPYCILLLDEIEKASLEVINLFLQVFDDGILTDSHGNKIDFQNVLIIMTSNIGCDKKGIGFAQKETKLKEINHFFPSSFVNRINYLIYFNDLDEKSLRIILNNEIKEVIKKYQQQNIRITFDKKIINEIIQDSHYSLDGARYALKLLEKRIDDSLLNNLLLGNKQFSIS